MKHGQNVVSLDKNLLVVSETIVHLLPSVKVMTFVYVVTQLSFVYVVTQLTFICVVT